MIVAGKDFVVRAKAQRQFFERLSSTEKRIETFPDAYHAIFHETNRREVINLIREFALDRLAKLPVATSLHDADKAGFTFREYEKLNDSRGWKFAIARGGMKIAERLSRGIEIGSGYGFDSGLSLDYVYENKARGSPPLGRLIDRFYLNSPGWRGVRQRKKNLEKALREIVAKLKEEERPIRILDIAAGGGRYVIETIAALPEMSISAILCDYRQENVDAARALADKLNLNGAIQVRRNDAFDRKSLAAIQPRATIGIVSGLYELFPANGAILNSLRGIAEAIEAGGYLIYTNQPWHPQLEFIARVLRNREGKPWVMRRRTTAEMDELVRTAGFEKIDMEIDEWGMFTVSVARKMDRPLPK